MQICDGDCTSAREKLCSRRLMVSEDWVRAKSPIGVPPLKGIPSYSGGTLMDYDKVTVHVSPAGEEGCHEFVTSGQVGHYGFRDVIRLVATTKSGSDFLSADVAEHFLVNLRNTIIASLGCNITRYASENDLPYYQIAKSSKPQHRILLDSCRYDQQQKLAPVVKSFGRKKNLEASNSLMQKILHYASSEFTLAFGAWKGEFDDGILDIRLHVQSDLYDIRTTQFVKQNRRRAWAFERTITRKMEQDLAQRVRGPLKRYKGVRWRPERKHPWVAEIKLSEKRKLWIGDFDTPEEAAQAFDVAVISHKKKTALNFKDSLVRTSEVVEQLPSPPSNKPFDITYDGAPPINVASIFHRRKRFVNQLEAFIIPESRSLDQLSSHGQTFEITHDHDEETTSNTKDPPKFVPTKSLKAPFLAEQRAHTKFAGVHHNELVSAVSFITSNLEASDSMLKSSSLVQLSAYEESGPLDSRSYDNVGAIPRRKEMMTANCENSSLRIPRFFREQLMGEASDASTTSDMCFESHGDSRVAGLLCGQLLNITHDDEVAAVCHKQGRTSHVDEDPPISVPSKYLEPPFLAEQCSDVKFAGLYHNDLQAPISCVTSNLDGSEAMLEPSPWVQVSAYEESGPLDSRSYDNVGAIPRRKEMMTANCENSSLRIPRFFREQLMGEASDASTTSDMCFESHGDSRVAGLLCGQLLNITHDDEVAAVCHKQGRTSHVDEDPPISVPSKYLEPPFLAEQCSDVKFAGLYHNDLQAPISCVTSNLDGSEAMLEPSPWVQVSAYEEEPMEQQLGTSKKIWDEANDMCFDMFGDPKVASLSGEHLDFAHDDDVVAIHHRQGTTSNVVEDPPSKSLKPPFLAEQHSEVKFEGVHNELDATISFSTSMVECGEEPLESRLYGNVGAISHRKETMTVNWENSSPNVPSALSKQPLDIASDIMCFDMLGDPRVAGSSVSHYNSNEEASSSTMPGWPIHDSLFDSLGFHDIFLDPNDFIQADSAGRHVVDRTAMLWSVPIASRDESHSVQGSVAPFQGIEGDLHDFLSPTEIDQAKDTDQNNQ